MSTIPDTHQDTIESTPGDDPRTGEPSDGRADGADDPASRSGGIRDALDRLAIPVPPWADRALDVSTAALKAATIACAIDALINADSPRLRGKAIRTRAFGYTGALFIVPVLWRLLPNRGRYPRGLDLAVTVPLFLDAAGNAVGAYESAHVDDVVHFLNAAIVSGVAGALFATQTDEPWQAAMAGTGTAIAGETAWEIAEYVAMKAGADGMDLTYDDTMADLAESTLGAIVGGIVTWLRMPRSKAERRKGWRHAVSGWRSAGEPMSLIGGRGTVAERAAAKAQ